MREARDSVNPNNVYINHSDFALKPNYAELIDLSKIKKQGFSPTHASDMIMPSALYKLTTFVNISSKNTNGSTTQLAATKGIKRMSSTS